MNWKTLLRTRMDRLFARRYTIEFEWKASQLCYRSVTLWMSWKSEKRPRSEDDTRHGPHNIIHKRKFRQTYTRIRRSWENIVYIFLGTFGPRIRQNPKASRPWHPIAKNDQFKRFVGTAHTKARSACILFPPREIYNTNFRQRCRNIFFASYLVFPPN